MSKLKRTLLVLLFVVLFFIVGGFAFFYSQGWRFTVKNFRVVKVGAIYLRTFPKDTSIELDGKQVKNTSWLFQDGTLFDNLFPKEYSIHIIRTGYLDWQRTIPVSPSYVAQIKYAVLVPEEKTAIPIGEIHDGSRVWRAGSGGNFIVKNYRGSLFYGSHRLPGDTVGKAAHDLSNIITYDTKTSSQYLFETSTASSTNLSALAKRHGMDGEYFLAFNVSDNNELIIASTDAIARYSIPQNSFTYIKSPQKVFGKNLISSLSASHAHVAFTQFERKRNISHLMIFDGFLNQFAQGGVSIPGKTLRTEFTKSDELAILQDDGSFYLYSLADNNLQKIARDAVSFTATADGNRFGVLERSSLEIFSRSEKADYRRFRLSSSDGITHIEWYKDGQHLFLYYPNRVAFLDVDDFRLEDLKIVSMDPNAVYEIENNVLYEAQNGALRELKFPS
jgi:hypothetical protein